MSQTKKFVEWKARKKIVALLNGTRMYPAEPNHAPQVPVNN